MTDLDNQTAYWDAVATTKGAVCRQHRADHFPDVLSGFDIEDTRLITVATMNGDAAAGIQVPARKAG